MEKLLIAYFKVDDVRNRFNLRFYSLSDFKYPLLKIKHIFTLIQIFMYILCLQL